MYLTLSKPCEKENKRITCITSSQRGNQNLKTIVIPNTSANAFQTPTGQRKVITDAKMPRVQKFPCFLCSRMLLQRHLQTHLECVHYRRKKRGQKRYCHHCDMAFDYWNELFIHIYKRHKPKRRHWKKKHTHTHTQTNKKWLFWEPTQDKKCWYILCL